MLGNAENLMLRSRWFPQEEEGKGDTSWTAEETTNSPTEGQDGKTKHAWRYIAIVMLYCLKRIE